MYRDIVAYNGKIRYREYNGDETDYYSDDLDNDRMKSVYVNLYGDNSSLYDRPGVIRRDFASYGKKIGFNTTGYDKIYNIDGYDIPVDSRLDGNEEALKKMIRSGEHRGFARVGNMLVTKFPRSNQMTIYDMYSSYKID